MTTYDLGYCAYCIVSEIRKKNDNNEVIDIDQEIIKEVEKDIEEIKKDYLNNIIYLLQQYNIESNLKEQW